jgi:hypothetical protein
MKTRIICRDVRSDALNDQARLIIIASQDKGESSRSIVATDLSDLSKVKTKLDSLGIVLGGTSTTTAKSPAQTSGRSPVELTASDELGRQRSLIADSWEEYELSSGSTLYYFYITDAPGDYHWVVGRELEMCQAQQALTHIDKNES